VDRVAVQVDTQLLSFPELFAAAAAPALGGDEEEIARRIATGPRALWLAQRVPLATGETLRSLAPDAVVLVPDSQRLYPLGRLASPVVGFVGREELRTVGRAGFEHHYDSLLAGEPATYLAVNDAVQRRLRLERVRSGRAGSDLELTIRVRLQATCETEIGRVLSDTGGHAASAVVMEVDTGRILALVSVPSFDPSAPADVPSRYWRLRPVQDAYEPGSLVKPFVAAAALADGVVRAGELFDCRDRGVRVAGHWMRDHAEPGIYTLDEVVAESANAGIVAVAERLEPELLWRAFAAFGFGRPTGVGFPAEASGILAPPRSWSALSRASLALGQELTVSPLQVAAAYAAIANGGWLLRPRLVAEGSGPDERAADSGARRCRVLDEALAGRLGRMLEAVVTHGTGEMARVAGYRVAGKTGTAQRAVNGGFDDEHHVAWFAGYLPLPDPRLVVVVSVENPQSDFWASSVAAPAFARIASAGMAEIGMPPTEPVPATARGGTT
jgi:cell division protein FtsI/penicillin-binding protein 2